MAAASGGAVFCSLQAYYSLVGRDLELGLLPMCVAEGIGVMVWSPLAGGFVTGKYRRNQDDPDGSRRTNFDFPPIDRERGYDVVEQLDRLAEQKGSSIPRLALSWVLQQQGVSTVVIGAKKMSQLEDNLAAVDVDWTAEELQSLAELTPPPRIYPNWMMQNFLRK